MMRLSMEDNSRLTRLEAKVENLELLCKGTEVVRVTVNGIMVNNDDYEIQEGDFVTLTYRDPGTFLAPSRMTVGGIKENFLHV